MICNPKIWTFVAAELIFILARSRDIIVIFKSQKQRNEAEKHQADRGLLRSLFLEAVLFVPASALLLILISPLLLPIRWFEGNKIQALYSTLGVVSYGFPFATVKHMITRLALKTLLEFALLAPEEQESKTKEQTGNDV